MKGQRLYDSIAEIVGEDFCNAYSNNLLVVCAKVTGSGVPQKSFLYALIMDAYNSGVISDVPNKYQVFVRNSVTGVGYDGTRDLLEKVSKYGQRVRRRLERASA